MPYTPINIGVSDDDNTGDTLRAAGNKINTNFAAVDTALAARALAADLTTEVAARTADVAALEAALALKADATDVVDPSTVTPHFDLAQTIDIDQRRTLAINTGGFVTLPFQLVDGATNFASGTFNLPFFPQNFIVHDIYIMLHQRTVGSGGTFQVAFTLDQGATNIGGAAAAAVTGAGKSTGTVVVAARRMTKELATSVTATVVNTETGSPVAKGATLWLRGVWEA